MLYQFVQIETHLSSQDRKSLALATQQDIGKLVYVGISAVRGMVLMHYRIIAAKYKIITRPSKHSEQETDSQRASLADSVQQQDPPTNSMDIDRRLIG
jgi:hypothetical protein